MIYKNACINGEILDFEVVDGKFSRIGKISEDGTDLKGSKVYPGLVDVHTHGCVGFDVMDGGHIDDMAEYLAKNGTTSWLPTTMTMDMETVSNVLKDTGSGKGAEALGFHAEGPYISPKYKGAQNERFIKAPDFEEFRKLENVKMVTIAPELEGSAEFIKKCDCIVSLGHTDADYECAVDAIEKGAICLTHTFNAMPPLHHRNPGVIGAAIDKEIYVQLICDGIHIHKSVVKMLYKTFGTDRLVLISDSMRATGLSDGEYDLGGQNITVKNSVARTVDGAIAGSTSVLFTCVKKAIEFGIPEEDAFKMASCTPAEMLGVKKGKIEVGYDADFIVLDSNLNILMTVVNGMDCI